MLLEKTHRRIQSLYISKFHIVDSEPKNPKKSFSAAHFLFPFYAVREDVREDTVALTTNDASQPPDGAPFNAGTLRVAWAILFNCALLYYTWMKKQAPPTWVTPSTTTATTTTATTSMQKRSSQGTTTTTPQLVDNKRDSVANIRDTKLDDDDMVVVQMDSPLETDHEGRGSLPTDDDSVHMESLKQLDIDPMHGHQDGVSTHENSGTDSHEITAV